MRRASTWLVLCGLAVMGLPAVASAAPKVTIKARAVPIPKNLTKKNGPTWPHTGNILGAPAAVEATFTIKGTEYFGFPAPLREVVVYLPKGTKLHPQGFKTCNQAYLEHKEPEKCSKATLASPPGEVRGEVQFGKEEPVKETVKVQGYFLPKKGIGFWIEGQKPVQIEAAATGKIVPAGGQFSLKEAVKAPLIVPVSGSHAASSEYINVKVGAARKQGKKLISYGTMPKTCPKGGFPVKAELTFGVQEGEGEGAAGSSPMETVTVTTKAPCPKGSAKGKKSSHKGHHKRK